MKRVYWRKSINILKGKETHSLVTKSSKSQVQEVWIQAYIHLKSKHSLRFFLFVHQRVKKAVLETLFNGCISLKIGPL